MGNYELLKAAINEVIKANGRQEITGEVLNQVLLSMVNSLGAGYQCMGVATPSTNPGTPDQNVFYFATQAGTYTNFDAIVLQAGISVLMWDGDWASQTWFTVDSTPTNNSQNLIASGAVFNALKLDGGAYDVSAHNSGATFASLSALLNSANINTLIPTEIRHGGMSIKFVQSSDNKYIQARCMAQNFTTDVAQWQGVDDEPTDRSNNLVKSGGIKESIELSNISSRRFISKKNTTELKNANTLYNYDGETLSKETSNAWRSEIFDIKDLLRVETAASPSGGFTPAIIYIDNLDIAAANVVGVEYGNIPTSNQYIKILKTNVSIPAGAKYAIVNYSTVGNDYTLNVYTGDKIDDAYSTSKYNKEDIKNIISELDNHYPTNQLLTEEGAYGENLVKVSTNAWKYRIFAKGDISYIETAASVFDMANGFPALIFIDNENPASANVIKSVYGTIATNNDFVKLYKDIINFPENATHVIVNYSVVVGDNYSLYSFMGSRLENIENDVRKIKKGLLVSVETKKIVLLNGLYYTSGNSLVYSNASLWKYGVLDVNDIDYLETAAGGSSVAANPPAYICLDSNDLTSANVLGVVFPTIDTNNQYIKLYKGKLNVPEGTKYVIVNYIPSIGDAYDLHCSLYEGMKKQVVGYKTISKPSVELMSHGNITVYDNNGNMYTVYLASETTTIEDPSNNILVRLSKYNICTPDKVEWFDVVKKNDIIGGVNIGSTAPYEPNIFILDNYLYIFFMSVASISENGYVYLCRRYNLTTNEFEDSLTPLTINNLQCNVSNVQSVYNTLATTQASEVNYLVFTCPIILGNDGNYYGFLGGQGTNFSGMIIKSTNLLDWTAVSIPPINYSNVIEAGLCEIEEGKLLCAFRNMSANDIPVKIGEYDYTNDQWSNVKSIYDSISSRPVIIKCNGEILVGYNKKNPITTEYGTVERTTMLIGKYEDGYITPIQERIISFGLHYFSFIDLKGTLYCVYSTDRRKLNVNQCRSNLELIEISN